jgi:hypothetical protein
MFHGSSRHGSQNAGRVELNATRLWAVEASPPARTIVNETSDGAHLAGP